MAPLPRAYQWADGSAYLNHVELVRGAQRRSAETFYTDPLMYQGGSDDFLGRCDDRAGAAARSGASTSRPSRGGHRRRADGRQPEQALDGIRLLMLANDGACAT
jgi:fumarylacetoacetate (FAA) hydrolase